jgi:hypothetical protein
MRDKAFDDRIHNEFQMLRKGLHFVS